MSLSQRTTTLESPALPVSLRGVGRSFGSGRKELPTTVLRDVDLEITAGEIVALIGPSGCGKSTLLRQISGLDTPTAGSITIDDRQIAPADQRCAVAFQEPRLLPWRTAARNVQLGLARGLDRARGAERVEELLELVHLSHARDQRPREISGGMAQRVSLARALARGPGVLLLDEPFGALDALTRLSMQDLLVDIHAAEPTTIVFVTHDVDEALILADRVVLLGSEPDLPGATIRRVITVPGRRPRDRADSELGELRAELLDGLGVPSHHSNN
ncbi:MULTISPECIES: ABC transporter ATP-binding protein [Microcella]|uniref:ABC transporter ATP-binding protein n=1 Tax=Microcella TaxID=337004 RepID=UPI0015CF7EE4|nr:MULTISPECIES: ABC transporter ATP-binding protein [Microcella]QOD94740.1 ABC transporter ATP-binding protein [Chryseoglobus sp. 28M-23]